MMPSDVSGLKHYDPSTIEVLRRALDDVLTDRRFYHQRSASALDIAEHMLAQAASGERDLERLKSSAFALPPNARKGFPVRPHVAVSRAKGMSESGIRYSGSGARGDRPKCTSSYF